MTEGLPPGCICRAVPKPKAIYVQPPSGIGAVFHKDCPLHGVVVGETREVREVTRQAWCDPTQAWAASRRDGAKLLQKSPDGKKALIEWKEYESISEGKEDEACATS